METKAKHRSERNSAPTIIHLNPPISKEKPSDYPTIGTVGKWATQFGLTVKRLDNVGEGFFLNAHNPAVKDKVTLTYSEDGIHYSNDIENCNIEFNQLSETDPFMGFGKRGWVKISFDPKYRPYNALIDIRVGAYGRPSIFGHFKVLFEGQVITYKITAKPLEFEAATISILINPTFKDSLRKTPLGDILIYYPDSAATWYFFDARCSTMLKAKK